jgi:U1 small nuclear ribonucleoprotein
MTHLLPPNLLKLFAPRAPIKYLKPLGRDPNLPKQIPFSGVAEHIDLIRREEAEKGADAVEAEEAKEKETFSLAEEEKRRIRWAEREKKREEEFKKANETCEYQVLLLLCFVACVVYDSLLFLTNVIS